MEGYAVAAALLKALAHPVRLQILDLLSHEEEACVCHLEAHLGQRQAYISQQLSRLRAAGLVVYRREGLNVFYSLAHPAIGDLLECTRQAAAEFTAGKGEALTFAPIPETAPSCTCPRCAPAEAAVKL